MPSRQQRRSKASQTDVWSPILRALDATPTDLTRIQGASGLYHPVVAAGADDPGKRLVVVSGEPTARGAALAQADIQAAAGDVRVVMARPVAVNLADFANDVRELFGTDQLGQAQFQRFSSNDQAKNQEFLGPVIEPLAQRFAFGVRAMGLSALFAQLIAQASRLKAVSSETKHPETGSEQTEWTLDFTDLAGMDPEEEDLALGICPIPIYSFSEHELGLIGESGEVPVVREILRGHDVYQYFYPSPDQLALGLVDRTPPGDVDVIRTVETAPVLGHPLGEMELVPPDTQLMDVIDALKERKLLIKGEVSQELSADGITSRATVKFRPKEGIVSKLVNRLSVSIDISTRFFGGG